jgi:glyoxylase-like metal-dependent hydrolase (beta-lactamase superfamily II)
LDTALGNKQTPSHVTQPSRQVHTITDRFSMSNTYLINDEHIIIVDPGSELNVRLTLNYLQQFLYRTPADIDLVVLTHLHPDHTAGVDSLRRICDVPVAASAAARQLVELEKQGNRVIPGITHFAGSVLSQTALPHFDLFPPHYASQTKMVDIWLEDVAGLPHHPDWRVIASPGHTPESLCLYNPFTYELICGDTIITTENGTPRLRGAVDRRQLEDTIRMLRNLEVHYLYPGHGKPILSKRPLGNLS